MQALEKDLWNGLGRLAKLAQVAASVGPGAPDDPPRVRAQRLHEKSKELVRATGMAVEMTGTPPHGTCVIVSNHISWFDPLLVASLVPVTGIAKVEVAQWPLLGQRARSLGVIFVDRLTVWGGVSALLTARRALEDGVSVLNFPEGTTTHGDMLLPFRRGIFGLARLMRVPVVPMRLEVHRSLTWAGPDPLMPHLVRLCTTRRPVVKVTWGQPIDTHGLSDAQVAEKARELMLRAASLRAMRPKEPTHATALSA